MKRNTKIKIYIVAAFLLCGAGNIYAAEMPSIRPVKNSSIRHESLMKAIGALHKQIEAFKKNRERFNEESSIDAKVLDAVRIKAEAATSDQDIKDITSELREYRVGEYARIRKEIVRELVETIEQHTLVVADARREQIAQALDARASEGRDVLALKQKLHSAEMLLKDAHANVARIGRIEHPTASVKSDFEKIAQTVKDVYKIFRDIARAIEVMS
ncbi:MAG: hypothetical protein AAB372_00985 [Patescibacteria group bacterium]